MKSSSPPQEATPWRIAAEPTGIEQAAAQCGPTGEIGAAGCAQFQMQMRPLRITGVATRADHLAHLAVARRREPQPR